MPGIEIRLLGTFEVRRGEKALHGFESQKVRALLAYLACHPDQAQDRGYLASLLWPEEDSRTARQNLRQAIYNLRQSLGEPDAGKPEFVLSTHRTIQLNPEADIWQDVQAFEQASRYGLKSAVEVDIAQLTEASHLYRGHLLPSFSIDDAPEIEEWLWEKREQLRELAMRGLRVLIGSHLENGDYALGIDHARSLVELDPLSEEAHRTLIHLYFLAGRRSQALREYESFAKRLDEELDVSPLSETQALYESILSDSLPGPKTTPRADLSAPFVSFEGRDEELEAMLDVWREVVAGQSRALIVDGPSGMGKSRLVKTFLHQATSEMRGAVLRGRAYDLAPTLVYGPVIELLRNAWRVGRAEDRHRFHRIPLARLALVRELLPEVAELDILESIDRVPEIEDRDALFAAVDDFLLATSGAPTGGRPNPLVVFVDDVQWADPASLHYLLHLLRSHRDLPLLLVMTCRPRQVGPEQVDPLLAIRRRRSTRALTVEPVDQRSIRRMMDALLEADDRKPLTDFLVERTGGQPLLITETINHLCDFDHLVPSRTNRWRVTDPIESIAEQVPQTSAELIRQRVRQLPSSTRRLLSHAALIGHRFDFHLLRRAGDEHVLVVETAIGLMLEHWLARQFPDAWASTHRERDIVLWAQGARRGTFEFAHKEIRKAIHAVVPEDRRAQLHRRIAEAIEKTSLDRSEELAEELAYHYLRADAWEEAAIHLRRAAQRAARLGADQSAHSYCADALDVAVRLEAAAKSKAERERWHDFSAEVEALRSEIADRLGPEALARYPSLSITLA